MKVGTATSVFFLVPIILALSTLVLADDSLLLRKQLNQSEWPESINTLVFTLYDSEYAGLPIANQTYFEGEWQVTETKDSTTVTVTFDELAVPGSHEEIWMELEADGKLVGRRSPVAAATSGVTFALGNVLDMDGNPITNVDDPVDSQDVATKIYVDNADITGNASTATALASNGGNCNAGEYPLGIDAFGAVEGCTPDATDDAVDTAELDNLCATNDKILKRIGGIWICADDAEMVDTNAGTICPDGTFLNGDGSCDPATFGDITAVIAGAGLTGGATSGEATLNVEVPLSLSGTIADDGVLQGINSGAGYGVAGSGNLAGGYFSDPGESGYAFAGYGDHGIQGFGNVAGGYFKDGDDSGYASVGVGDYGIRGFGYMAGGYFSDPGESGYAFAGYGDHGIQGFGNVAGGYFKDSDNSGYASVGVDDYGIRGFGYMAGGYFKDGDDSGYAYVGTDHYGIQGYGNLVGGFFKDGDDSGYAYVGYGNSGISGVGNSAGGYFRDSDSSGYAYVGTDHYGIRGFGYVAGGYFKDGDSSGYAYVGAGDYGIMGYGNVMGGYFIDLGSSAFAEVGSGSHKILGSGSVNFVQNHPENSGQVIVYAAPEGDEVATYTRGTAKLVDGEARVPLGETFKWVTNPDIGLTAHLTPRGRSSLLYVASLTTQELIVKSDPDFPDDVTFDYIVYGLRIGFEESSIVQEKTQEAYIPSMDDHRERYVKHPELRQYNALERFGHMRADNGMAAMPDMNAAEALRDAIEEFDPEVHKLPHEKPELPPQPQTPVQPDSGPPASG